MDRLSLLVRSSVGRKLLNGVTGVLLCGFIAMHLLGNINILIGADAFNHYAANLWELGEFLYIMEVGLAAVFLLHALVGISVYVDKQRARQVGYAVSRGAGGTSRRNISSRSMAITGVLLLAFLVWHLWQFRFGPHYTTTLNGREVRDLYRVVVDVFATPLNVVIYEVLMILLGVHLRHGFWSAFQTMGVRHPKYTRPIYATGIAFAVVIAAGFLTIPVYVFLAGGAG